MRKNILLCTLALAGLTAFAQKNEWQDPNVNAINVLRCTPIILLTSQKMLL